MSSKDAMKFCSIDPQKEKFIMQVPQDFSHLYSLLSCLCFSGKGEKDTVCGGHIKPRIETTSLPM